MRNLNNIFTIISTLIIITISGTKSYCQENADEPPIFIEINQLLVKPSYQFSFRPAYYIPLAGTKSYIDNTALKPISLSFEYVTNSNKSYGLELSNLYFEKKIPRAIYDYDGTIISSTQVRTLRIIPISIFVNRYLKPIDHTFRPYVNLGIGANRINYNTYWGTLPDEKKKWAPLATVGLGIKINLDKSNNWLIDSKIKYQYAPFTYDFISRIHYLSADLSLAFRWWSE
jgi:outer membrane protein W